MEIQDELKYRVFNLIDRNTTVQEFEEWLYVQEQLVNDLENDLYLTLFSVDYHHRSFEYDFKSKMFTFYDYEEFVLWKVKLNLTTLIDEDNVVKRKLILKEFEQLALEGYNALDLITYNLYYYEDYMPQGYGDYEINQMILDDAVKLLKRIHIEEIKNLDFKLSDIDYNDLYESHDYEEVSKADFNYDKINLDKERKREDVINYSIALIIVFVVSLIVINGFVKN